MRLANCGQIGWALLSAAFVVGPLQTTSTRATVCDRPEKVEVERFLSEGENASIVWNGNGYGVTWIRRDPDRPYLRPSELLFARLDPRGRMIGGEVLISDEWTSDQPTLAWNGDGYGLLWRESILFRVFFIQLDALGFPVGDTITISVPPWGEQTDNVLLIWADTHYALAWSIEGTIRFSRYDRDGEILGETVVTTRVRAPESLVWNGFEYSLLTRRLGRYWIHRLDGAGHPLDDGRLVVDEGSSYLSSPHGQHRGAHVWTGSGYGVIMSVCLFQNRKDNCDLVFGLLDAEGATLRLETMATNVATPTLAWTGSEFGVIWQLHDATGTWFTRVGPDGRPIDAPMQVTLGFEWQFGPQLTWNGEQFGWTVETDGIGSDSIWFARIGCDCTDVDADGQSTCDGDCDDGDPSTYLGAVEVNDGMDNQCLGDSGFGLIDELGIDSGFFTPYDKTEYSWADQPSAAGYEVARSTTRDFSTDCGSAGTAMTFWFDEEEPPTGGVFYYLSRALAPYPGSWGAGSDGMDRVVVCP